MKFILLFIIISIVSAGLIYQSSYSIEWKTFSTDKISIEYPSNWVVTQRGHETTHPADLNITNPNNYLNQFRVVYENDFWVNHEVQSSGVQNALNGLGERFNVQGGIMSTIIGEHPSASVIATYSGYWPGHGKYHIAFQMFIIDRNDKSSLLVYQDDFENFSSSGSQEIMNYMINSVRFLD